MMTILIVEGDGTPQEALDDHLSRRGYAVVRARDEDEALRSLRTRSPRVVIAGTTPNAGDPLRVSRRIRQANRRVPIILVPADSSEDLAIAALNTGINEYLRKPIAHDDVEAAIQRCLASSPSAAMTMAAAPAPRHGGARIIGESGIIQRLKIQLLRIASADCNVLISGETGTGKELAAEFIHENSRRRAEPFVRINCAAIPDSLVESELFGYEKGAFTGADSQREGMLGIARRGTVLLDEVGDMSPSGQAKMLRAVDTKEVRLLGAKGSVPLDVRLIAATNRDLEQLVSEGRFRQDLYFRLNVARVRVPALKERKEDIPPLAAHYLREMTRRLGREAEEFAEPVLEQLLLYDWPGNVRELKNLVEASLLNSSNGRISLSDIPEHFRIQLLGTAVTRDERERLLLALFSTKWNKSEAAQRLRWSRMTLYRKMAKYQIKDARSA